LRTYHPLLENITRVRLALSENETVILLGLTENILGLRLFVIFGEQGMGLLSATLGIGSNWTRRRLLKHLLPLYPAPAAWRLSQLAPRITKTDEEP
jgi:hypothetical protein